jgi:RimJ/RimL family protein N-acetyltransferase
VAAPEPVTLAGRYVRLEPLAPRHLAGLVAVGLDPDLWRWTNMLVDTPEKMRGYLDDALAEQARGLSLPFATLERESGRVVGSTRFTNIDPTHRRVEIGATWIAPPWQRTAVNSEAKLLMLRHAFDTLRCIRVELKTDALNLRSREAIRRLGAQEEGTLRRHMVTYTGRVRDTVYHSILDSEWPAVRTRLEARLAG